VNPPNDPATKRGPQIIRVIRVATALTVVALLLAGCTSHDSGDDHAPSLNTSKPAIKDEGVTAKGGTVYLLSDSDFTSLDPVDNDVTNSAEVGRLVYRTLTFIKDTPGEEVTIEPDLAEELGKSSDGEKTWTYRIRRGLKYEDGTPITARDIKYGIERSFAQDIYKHGATYLVDRLVNDNQYAGPYVDPAKDLTSVETPDDYTLVFHFSGAQPDSDWMMSLFYTAPVPRAADVKLDYANRPLASGPYKFDKYVRNQSLTLVRNDQWDAARDSNRPAFPDRFGFTFGVDRGNISDRLLRDDGTDKNAASLDRTLRNTDLQHVTDDPSVNARFITNKDACVDSIVLNNQKIVDPEVRHAIAVAIDRGALHTVYGGDLFGSLADSVLSPTLPGYKPVNLNLKPNGDPDAAKQMLAGKSVPTLHYLAYQGSDRDIEVANQVAAKLKPVGVDVVVDLASSNNTYDNAMVGDDPPALSTYGWCYDWPTSSSVVPPLLGPDASGKTFSPTNYSRYYDPAVSSEIRQLSSSTENANTIATRFNEVVNEVQMTAWPMLPFLAERVPLVVGSNLTNAGVSAIFGELDLNTMAVKS
jgi:peptide/nickel transport system substrate-binding protein